MKFGLEKKSELGYVVSEAIDLEGWVWNDKPVSLILEAHLTICSKVLLELWVCKTQARWGKLLPHPLNTLYYISILYQRVSPLPPTRGSRLSLKS